MQKIGGWTCFFLTTTIMVLSVTNLDVRPRSTFAPSWLSSLKYRNSAHENTLLLRPLHLRGGRPMLSALDDVKISIDKYLNDDSLTELCSVNTTALDEFASKVDVSQLQRIIRTRFQLPLVFDDTAQEIDFHAIRHGLNFGSSWQEVIVPRHGEKGRPHKDSVLHGLIQLHMEGIKLGNTEQLGGIKIFPLSQAFNIPLTKEERLDGGPIRQDVPSDFRQLIDSYYNTMSQIGGELQARGFKSLAEFILSIQLQGHSGADDRAPQEQYTANRLVSRLASCFDCFRDETTLTNPTTGAETTFSFHRKAQVMAEDLCCRFAQRDSRLNFTDLGCLLLGSDAETALQLRRKNILTVAPALAARIDGGKDLRPGSREEVALRAGSAHACASIAARVQQRAPDAGITAAHIALYFDYLTRDAHLTKVKALEAAADAQVKSESERIYEIPAGGAAEGSDADAAADRMRAHKCKDSCHY